MGANSKFVFLLEKNPEFEVGEHFGPLIKSIGAHIRIFWPSSDISRFKIKVK